MPFVAGTRLGPYEIVAPLGAGGMGEVYRARDTRLGREVAVKVLSQHLSSSSEVRIRFEREAKTVSSLNHPHICTLHDVGREGDTDFLVMELVQGETLAARLDKGALSTMDLLRLGAQIADALDRAHRAGIVHRDLKPGNVMLTKSGAKLMDFGLARTAGLGISGSGSEATIAAHTQSPSMSRPLTAEGTILGTFQYMAPEQLEGNEADARSDLWALGCVLYEMATGKRAFEGKSQASLIASIMNSEPAPISMIAPMTPPSLQQIVRACLMKDPADRVQSAHDVKLQLTWIAEGGSQAEAPAPVVGIPAERERRSGRERIAWAIAVLGLAAFSSFAWLSHPTNTELIQASISSPAGTALLPFASLVAVSPDGRNVVFKADDSTGTSLWIRPLDSATATQLPGTRDCGQSVFWSDDSRSIAYMSNEATLNKVAIRGGSPATLCNSRSMRGGTWNREGVIVFAPAPEGPLMRVSSSGGQTSPVTALDAARHETSHRFPSFLPDGDHFLYVSLPPSPEGWETYVGSLKSKSAKKVLTAGSAAVFAEPGYLVFARDGQVMAQRFNTRRLELEGDAVAIGNAPEYSELDADPVASASRNGRLVVLRSDAPRTQLGWLDRTGANRGLVRLPSAPWQVMRLSPDERQAAVMNGTEIWIVDLERSMPTRIATTLNREPSLVWSPDGKRLAFASRETRRLEVYIGNPSGSGEPELIPTTDALFKSVEDWSSDGRTLVLGSLGAETDWDIWYLTLDGDRKPQPVVNSPFNEVNARLSPDGRWLAFQSTESGVPEIYIQSFPNSGTKARVSKEGGEFPVWTSKGKELVYERRGVAMVVSIDGADELRIGEPRALFNLPDGVTGMSISADGERFLVSASGEDQRRDIQLYLNWTAALAR
jgi:serine/threonine protein kinase